MFRVLFLSLVQFIAALRFEIAATQGQGTVRCFEQTVTLHTLVKGKVDIPTRSFQTVDFTVSVFGPRTNQA